MKKFFFSIFTITLLQFSTAQVGGSLDPSFNSTGYYLGSLTSGTNKARAIALLADGSFIVAGSAYSSATGNDVFVLKLHSDGTPANEFGTSGSTLIDVQTGSEDIAYSVAVDESTGKFVIAGSSDNGSRQYALLLKFNANGALDSTFGTNGKVLTGISGNNTETFYKVKIHALSGNIIAAGSSAASTASSSAAVVRYTSNGILDNSFNGTGIKIPTISGSTYSILKDVYVATNGKITSIGMASSDISALANSVGLAVQLNANGTSDNSFGTSGSAKQSYMSLNNSVYMDNTSGYIYMAGNKYAYFGAGTRTERATVKRITSDGAADNWAYAGSNPYHYLVNNYYEAVYNAMCVTPDGQFLVAGSGYRTNIRMGFVMKLNANGGADYTFSSDPQLGQAIFTSSGNNVDFFDMVLQPDNKIVIAGYSDNNLVVMRLFGSTTAQPDSFQLLSPANNSTGLVNNDVELDWSDALGATAYEVNIDTTPNFSAPVSLQTGGSNSHAYSYQLNLQINKTYYWRVRAIAGSQTGSWKGTWKFSTTTDSITLIQPANTSTNVNPTNITFDWSDIVAGNNAFIQKYNIEIATNQSFSGAFSDEVNLPQSSYTSSSPLAYNTTYYWRVRSHRAGEYGPWSEAFSFTTMEDIDTTSPVPTGIENLQTKNYGLYPNPAKNTVSIHSIYDLSNAQISLLDITGKKIEGKLQNETVNIEALSAGFYVVEITNKGETVRLKFCKE